MSFGQIGFELGMAVSDYNNGILQNYDTIIKYTLLYISHVQKGVTNKIIKEEDLGEFYIVIGQAWASIHQR